MIEAKIPEDTLRRDVHRKFVDDGECLEAVGPFTPAEQDYMERQSLRGGGPSGRARGEKRKFEDWKPTVTAKRVKKQ